jgi:hypothetical protein
MKKFEGGFADRLHSAKQQLANEKAADAAASVRSDGIGSALAADKENLEMLAGKSDHEISHPTADARRTRLAKAIKEAKQGWQRS